MHRTTVGNLGHDCIIRLNGSYAQCENYKNRYFCIGCNTFLRKMAALKAAKRDVTF